MEYLDGEPGNVMLTKSGAKLLDFGLAKLRASQAPVANLSALPTDGINLTAQGTILGTQMDRPDFPTMEQVEKPTANNSPAGIDSCLQATRLSSGKFSTDWPSDFRKWAG